MFKSLQAGEHIENYLTAIFSDFIDWIGKLVTKIEVSTIRSLLTQCMAA